MKGEKGGFGADLPGKFGRLLMRDAWNSELYGPLQFLYEEGQAAGSDVWIHKNRYATHAISVCKLQFGCFEEFGDLRLTGLLCRMSGLWGGQSALDLYLQEEGITTLLFAGVNADQVRTTNTNRAPRRCHL